MGARHLPGAAPRTNRTARLRTTLKIPHYKLLCIALCAGSAATVAYGHATLLQTQPASGSRLDQAPASVSLSFNERVEPLFNSIEVFAADGAKVDAGASRVVGQGDVLQTALKPLSEGAYTVLWRINSVDGHQIQGHFGFGVGVPPPSESDMRRMAAPASKPPWSPFALAVKWTGLAALATWLGSLAFRVSILIPAARDGAGRAGPLASAARRSAKIVWSSAAVYFATQTLALISQAATFANRGWLDVLSLSTLTTVLAVTSYGRWWTIRMAAAAILLVVCAWPAIRLGGRRGLPTPSDNDGRAPRQMLPAIFAGLLGGVMLVTIPLTGHAGATPQGRFFAIAADWTHLAATAVWLGGLVSLLATVTVLDRDGDRALLNAVAHRFSRVARVCVAALVATGVYSAWLHLPSWSSFLTSDYGRVLLVKLGLVGGVLVIAATNLRGVLPALARGGSAADPARDLAFERARKWAGRFRTLLRAEIVLAAAVLAAVALLTSLPPATAVTMAAPVALTKPGQRMSVTLRLDSRKVGVIPASVVLQDPAGQRLSGARRVTIFARMMEMDMGLETVQAAPMPDGSYGGELTLNMPGRWLLSVEVTPPRGDTFVTEFEISAVP